MGYTKFYKVRIIRGVLLENHFLPKHRFFNIMLEIRLRFS